MSMHTDSLGIPYFSSDKLIELIYEGNIEKCHDILCKKDSDLEKFNKIVEGLSIKPIPVYQNLSIDQTNFDKICQNEWFMPPEYKNIDMIKWLSECLMKKLNIDSLAELEKTSEYKRTMEEIKEFKKRNLENLLKYLIFLVDTMKENKIMWGVGRGSSVASYVLFLIGVHRIDPLKYSLDWKEFLK